jgi:hypothetical protein
MVKMVIGLINAEHAFIRLSNVVELKKWYYDYTVKKKG